MATGWIGYSQTFFLKLTLIPPRPKFLRWTECHDFLLNEYRLCVLMLRIIHLIQYIAGITQHNHDNTQRSLD